MAWNSLSSSWASFLRTIFFLFRDVTSYFSRNLIPTHIPATPRGLSEFKQRAQEIERKKMVGIGTEGIEEEGRRVDLIKNCKVI